ncbi:MAG: sulfite oxidase-like oxidoreductase [Bacilli bacterium]
MKNQERKRLPAGQYLTAKWPVLHAGTVPQVNLDTWTFTISGLLDKELTLTWPEFMNLPQETYRCDIHCVTTWSRYDNEWQGVPFRAVMDLASVDPHAGYVLAHAEQGFTANIPLEELIKPGVMFAHRHDGKALTPEHGYPLRLVVPHLYFWKSVKWIRGIEFLKEDRPGFWEERGYHLLGDPFVEDEQNPDGQRFRDDPEWFGDESPEAMAAWRERTRRKRGDA